MYYIDNWAERIGKEKIAKRRIKNKLAKKSRKKNRRIK